MTKRTAGIGTLLICLALSNAFGDDTPSPRVSDGEFAELVKEIDEGQDMLLSRITNLTDNQWYFKQAPDRWSVSECVEHISRTERAILGGIAQAIAGPPNPKWFELTNGKVDLVRKLVPNRNPGGAGGFKAILEVSPSENWDRARGFREFYASHGELRAYIETMPREIKNRTFPNPFPEFGMLNAYDWLNLAALHVIRHTKQIIEVQEDPDYPKKAVTAAE